MNGNSDGTSSQAAPFSPADTPAAASEEKISSAIIAPATSKTIETAPALEMIRYFITSPVKIYAAGDFFIFQRIKCDIESERGERMGRKPKDKNNPKVGSVLMAHLGMVHMEISSNREVVFEGSKGIIEYGDSSIKINAGKYVISFNGRNLRIKSMNDCDLVIQGFITSIEYIF